jgi:formylglycine-generating enzyme required for sulfatase activity
MKRLMIKRISLVTLLCFFSLLLTDAYPLAAGQEEDGLALILKGESDYGNGLYQDALAAFNQALGVVQKSDSRERLLLDISLTQYALKDDDACQGTLRTLLELNSARQIDMTKFPEGFVQLYGQVNWQLQEAKAEQKKIEEQRLAAAQTAAVATSGLVEKAQPQAQIKKKKFPWLLAILGAGIVVVVVYLLAKKKKAQAADYLLNVTIASGVNGTPAAGTYSYTEGQVVSYNYTPLAGYISVEVRLNGSVVASSGSITMDQDYTLVATAITENYDYDTRVLGINWISIPAGEFKMGDSHDAGGAEELPVHTVSLSAYSISKYEITFAQYDKFCSETGRSKPSDGGWGRGTMPVINVSWTDADAFCTWLAKKTGKLIHLATEAQWERAAAGTDQRKYPWGDSAPTCSRANFNNCLRKTRKVGGYPSGASACGAMDMGGNAWEWVQDWFSDTYYQECADVGTVSNPQGPTSGNDRILRGGGYSVPATRLRCSFRDYVYPTYKSKVIGFRIAWDN